MNHELSKSQRELETDPADSCHSSWAYKSQQTVSDIDLETTPGFHKLQEEIKICKGIPNRQHLPESSTLASEPKTSSEVTYKDQ
jgi:hypothetical protein